MLCIKDFFKIHLNNKYSKKKSDIFYNAQLRKRLGTKY